MLSMGLERAQSYWKLCCGTVDGEQIEKTGKDKYD